MYNTGELQGFNPSMLEDGNSFNQLNLANMSVVVLSTVITIVVVALCMSIVIDRLKTL